MIFKFLCAKFCCFCAFIQDFILFTPNFNSTTNSNIIPLQATTPAMRSTTTLKQYGSRMVKHLRECNGLPSNSTTPSRSAPSVLLRKLTNPSARRRKSTSKDRVKNISAHSRRCGYYIILCRRVTSGHMAN